MQLKLKYSFRKILIPVDFTFNTELAIKKAIELIDPWESIIYLVHVKKPKFILEGIIKNRPSIRNKTNHLSEYSKLQQWKNVVEETMPGVTVRIHLIHSKSVEGALIQKAAELNPQLIIISTQSKRKWPFSRKAISHRNLAERTQCAVLAVRPGSMHTKIRSIVIPVGSFIPKQKLNLLVPLAWERNATIYLLSILNESNGFDDSPAVHSLIEIYRLLKEEGNCKIVHKLVPGKNIGRIALRFAQSINADILLVNPEESGLSFFGNQEISDLLKPNSTLQVLAIDRGSQNY
jgi:nucleotide-binding universal stress UspA family protein